MIIGMCGPGGSGKSTLAQIISFELGLKTLPSATRSVIASMGLDDGRDLASLDKNVRLALQTRALVLHVQNELAVAAEGFVSDRTIYDFSTYFETFFPRGGEDALWYRRLPSMMRSPRYDLIVYVPPFSETPPEADGIRYVGAGAWVEDRVQKALLSDVRASRKDVLVLRSKTIEDRVHEVVSKAKRTRVG